MRNGFDIRGALARWLRFGAFAAAAVALCIGIGQLASSPLAPSAYAEDGAADIKPIEEQPVTTEGDTSASGGTSGGIDSTGSIPGQSSGAGKERAGTSQDAALLESDANRVNTHQVPDSSFIYDMSIIDLASADSYHDNQIVQVLGEVVGDQIFVTGDPSHCWITLDAPNTDIDATIVVYMSTEAAQAIDTYGKYGVRGTMLQARGTFHLACSEHEGISDIHADYVTVVQPGAKIASTLEFSPFIPGLVTLALGGLLVVMYARLRERER